jgi:hypothetical protein
MIRLRRRYTLQRIMLMIAALGAALGVFVSPMSPRFWSVVGMVGIILVFAFEGFPVSEILEFLGRKTGPTRLRRGYALPRIIWLVVAVGLPLAIGPRLSPPVPLLPLLPLEITVVLLIVVEGVTLIEWGVLVSICMVLTGLLIPPVIVHGRPRRPARQLLPASSVILESQKALETDEPIMCIPSQTDRPTGN